MIEKSSHPVSLAPPESFFVFAVGNCEEWPENREEQGDVALVREYLNSGVPNDQCVYLKDGECTRDNCQEQLESFLKKTRKTNGTLVFYYGGHGISKGFSTIGGTWSHRQIVRTMEESFGGDRILFLLDCCAAGNLCRHFSSTKQCALLGTSPPYLEFGAEGDEWIISNTWIQIVRRSRDLSLENIISIMADRHMYELGEMFFAHLTPDQSSDLSWMPAWNGTKETIEPLPWLSETDLVMPREAKISSVFDCRVGDAIAYKHLGGNPVSQTSPEEILPFYVPPLWLNGTIISISQNEIDREETNDTVYNITLRIRVRYPSQTESWEVEISHSSPRLVNHFFVAQNWMMPKSFLETQVVLAQKYQQYLDCSLVPNTSVRVALSDNEILEGTVVDWRDFDWKQLLQVCTGTSVATTDYDDYYWNELPVPVKAAAKALGYSKSKWDKDTGIPADKMHWDDLSKAQKDAATVLGYKRPKSLASTDSVGSCDLKSNPSRASSANSRSEISTCSGPHVPIEWDNSQEISLVPLKQILRAGAYTKNEKKYAVRNAMTRVNSPSNPEIPNGENPCYDLKHQCLLQGLQSSGKTIRNAKDIFGTSELCAFWVENETWYDAVPIDIEYDDQNISWVDGKNKALTLDLLATHFEYTLSGIYCPIKYEDGERHLIPLNYICRRGCQSQQVEEGSDGESDSDSNTPTTVARASCRFCRFWRTK